MPHLTEPRPLIGLLLMTGATMCFALLDALSKHLSQTFPVPMLVWGRYTFHFLMMVIFLAPSMGWTLIRTTRPRAQIVRALMLTGVTGFAMAGFSIMPLAESTAILFVTPLLVVVAASVFLKESISRRRWLAVITGFAGALLIARPQGALSAQGILFMTLAAVCYAIYQIQTRQLSPTENTVTMVFYTAMVGSVATTLAAPLYWGGPVPTLWQAAGIAALGICGGTGHLMLIRAFRHAEASVLSPLQYVQLIWAGALGWWFFGQLPDWISLIGMVIIAASSISLATGNRPRRAT